MVQVSNKGSCEPLVAIVKIEARLEIGSKANGTCLQCQSNYCDLKKKAYMLVEYTFKYTLFSQ
jgi:hypothetical protein